METNILLESGTNELEILEFMVGDNHYGINVAKIKEILTYSPSVPVPNSHPGIEGIIKPRNEVISVISMPRVLNMPEPTESSLERSMYIVTNFNNLLTAFHVDNVIGIKRVSWTQINKPDSTITNGGNTVATGIVTLNNKLVIILDFEKIVAEISPETGIQEREIDELGYRERNTVPILYAEDSLLLSKMIHNCLEKAGYTNLLATNNGLEAWNYLCEVKEEPDLNERIGLVITDLEMPQMDGHKLLKNIKTDPLLSHIPVIIFSSLINDDMKRKGDMLGADAQLSKPEIGKLVSAIDGILAAKSSAAAGDDGE